MIKRLILLFFLVSCSFSYSQLVIQTTYTPEQLVQQFLVGTGITASNVSFNGAPNVVLPRDQAARFLTNGGITTAIGIKEGVLLTTGQSTLAYGPNNAAGSSLQSAFAPTPDPDLQMIATQPIQKGSILEFDFVAQGKEVSFDFVFASEEYDEYSTSAFNDVFGFFISGPGITGPFTNNAKNIALLPSSTTGNFAVTMNNVNNGAANNGPCTNCQYYTHNNTNDVQYDGFTKVLTAKSAIQCGQTYHIKLAVSNVSDNGWDSAVFIKKFSITPLELTDSELSTSGDLQVCPSRGDITITSGIPAAGNTFVWYFNNVLLPLETGPNLTTGIPGTYKLEVFTNPGNCLFATDTFTFDYAATIPYTEPLDITLCTTSAGPYTFASIDQTTLVSSTLPDANDYLISYYDSSEAEAKNGSNVGLLSDPDLVNYQVNAADLPKDIWIRIESTISGCVETPKFTLGVSSPTGTFSYASPLSNITSTPQLPAPINLTTGGVYSAVPNPPSANVLAINSTTGAVTPNTSNVGIYTVSYFIAATPVCPPYETFATVEIVDAGCSNPINPGPICEGQSFNLNGTPLTGAHHYGWTGPGYTSNQLNNPSVPYPTGGTTPLVYILTAYDALNNVICFRDMSITVNPTPAIVITNPAAVCFPATVDITTTAITAGSTNLGTLSYWTNAAATTPLTNPNAISTSGTYYIKSTNGSCSDVKPVAVTINATPVVTIVNPPSVCTPTTVNITANTVITGNTASGTLSYWTDIAATIPLTNPTTVAVSGTYYIKSTNGNCFDIEPVTVTIVNTPAIVITNPAAVCFPATVDITTTAITAGSTNLGTLSYWTNAAATTPLTNPNAISTSGTYYIKSTNGSCSDVKPVIVTINATPVVTIVNPPSVCTPTTVNITANTVITGNTASGTLSYWTDAAATIPLTNPTTVAVSGTYYIKSTNGNCFDIEPVTVTIVNTPAIVITNPAAVCFPATVDITTTAITAGSTNLGTLSYWTNAAATTPLTNSTAVTTSGTYFIKSTNGSCSDVKPVIVTINATPVVTIVNPPSVCTPTTVNITANTVITGNTASGTLSYWTDAAATIPLTNPTTVAVSGTYYIKSTNGNCFDIEPVTVTIVNTPAIVITNPAAVCFPATVDITTTAITAGSTNLGTLSYWTNAAATTPLTNSTAVSTSGTYFIKSTNGSCSDVKPVIVTINATPVVTIVNPPSVCTPTTVNITANTVITGNTASGTLSYWTDIAATIPLTNPTTVAVSGTYYIKSTNGNCFDIEPVT
ncbi:choice-of-anchor L domain-containing protein, partial [Flavobacterium sp.]|uniref:choice-of-anchor L domain-containing protein n=1 Tax=Flavobacterium sp. TaxID=239 RepID=UPI0037C10B1F